MNTKERILKFLLGRAISRKDYDEAKAGYGAALENATDEQKQMASAYLQSVLNKLSADPKTNKHARHMGAEAYRVATTMLNGTFDEATVQTPLGTTGPRTRRQDYADAGNVAADFIRKNADRSSQTSSTTGGSTGGRYYFDAFAGLNNLGEAIGATRGSKIKAYAEKLYENIKAAQNAENSGQTVYNGVDNMYNDLSKLQALLNTDLESDSAYNTLLDIAGRYDNADHWSTYFGDLLPRESELDKRKKALAAEGWTDYDLSKESEYIRNLANKRGYNIMQDKAGNFRIYDKDYINQIKDILEYNANYSDEGQEGKGFGHALIADNEGNVYLGDTNNIDINSPFAALWNDRLEKDRARRNKLYYDKDWVYGRDDADKGNPYLHALESYFGGSYKGTDVSQLFQGSDKVFATSSTGKPYLVDDRFGGIRFNPDAKFYKVSDDGKVLETTWAELAPKFNPEGWGESAEQFGRIINLDEALSQGTSDIDENTDIGGRTFWTALKSRYGADNISDFLSGIGGLATSAIAYGAYDNIKDDYEGFVHNLLNAVAKKGQGELHTKLHGMTGGNAELLQNLKYNEKKNDYIVFLYNLFNNQPELWNKLSNDEKNTFIAMKREYNRQLNTPYEKQGGIIKAAQGTVISGTGEPLGPFVWEQPAKRKSDANISGLRERYKLSQEKGYGDDLYRKDASETGMFKGDAKMSTADAMRIATMAQDAASIVASFVPGAGTGVAAGLGVTALGTDLIADILDPAVSAGEVAKNAVMNAGFAGLGLIPGAKMTKVAKNIIKYAPKIITAAAAMGIAMDDSTLATFKKLGDGTAKLNREDWRNLSHVLSLVAAGTRGIKGDIARHKVKKGIVNGDQVTIKGLIASDGKSPVSFSKEKIAEVNKALGEIKPKEEGAQAKALTVLKEKLGLTDEQATQVLNSPGFLKTKTGLGKFSIGEESLLDEGKTYDNLRTIWNEEAKNVRNSSKVGKWFANKFGGGDYTAKQRAILELNPETTGIDAAKLMQYKGSNNPMIDWQNLRGKAGEATISARPVIYDLFTNVGQEAQLAHRAELAQLAKQRRAEIREKAGVNKAYADIDENERGISGLTRAIQGNDERIAEINSQLRDANIELGKVIGLQRALLTEPRVAKAALSKASKELSKAVTAAEAALGGPLSIKNGRYVNKRTYTAEQRKLIANLNRLVDRKNAALQRVSGLPERVAEVKSSRDAIERQVAEYNKNIADLENEQLGGVRLMQRREANRSILNNELEARQNRARQMNPRVQDEINSRGIQLEGQLDRSVRISGQTIKNGATITSFEYIKNASSMPPQGFNRLKLTDVNKVFPGLKNLRGAAYNPTTNQIIVWRDGGKVNYQKLRK